MTQETISKHTQLDQYIAVEQSRALSRQMPALLISTLVVGLITTGALWNHFSHMTLLLWFLSVVLLVSGRWWTTRKFSPESTNSSNHKMRLRVFTFWFLVNGLNWGIVAFLFHDPNTPIYSVYLICVLVGYVSVGASSTSLFLPAFFGFSVPASSLFFIRFITEDGTLYPLLAFSTPFYLVVMIAFARIANRNFKATKTLEFDNAKLLIEVTEQKAIAETAVIEKNQFLAATSHDLRQPLHAMGLYVDALRPRLSDSLDQEILEKIALSSGALNELLHGLLDISRLDASVVENRPQHVYLNRITRQLSSEFDSQATQRGLDLQFDINNEHVVLADPILLERVLRNLLSNAVKYTETGFVKCDETIEIKVSDSGIGIPEEQTNAIFSEFTQLGNPERDRNKGLGLGLAIVKRLCELQKISYQLESKLGKGTSVTLSVPQGDGALRVLEKTCNTQPEKQLNILFIDDEEAIREGMKMLISSWQCVPLIASGRESAMRAIQSLDEDLDIIVSDLRLREDHTGIELIKLIREELNQEVPAIIVTGDTAVDRLELSKHSNIVMLHKPIKPAELRRQIVQLLDELDQA